MAQRSNYYPILQGVQSIVNGLALVDWNSAAVPSVIRKLPSVDQTIDTLPLFAIVPKDEPGERKKINFTNWRCRYPVEVVAIAAGNRDFTSHLDVYTAWQDTILNGFKTPAGLQALVPAVWQIAVQPGLVIDRSQVNDNYDYGGLTIDVFTME